MTQSRRIEDLDAFRALAILPVMLFHFTYRWGPLNSTDDLYRFNRNWDLFSAGWLGVDFFFIISGFVIFMTIEACSSARDFAIRRISRLYLTYIFCMTVTFLLVPFFGVPEFNRTFRDFLVGFSMQSPMFNVPWIDGAYWSLLVEIKFYFWIMVLYFVARRHFSWAWLCFSVCASVLSIFPHSGADGVLVVTALPFFSAGMAFYRRYADGKFSSDAAIFFGAAIVTYLAAWYHQQWQVHALIALMIVVFFLFVLGKMRWIAVRPLVFVGTISYPLYLVHQHIGTAIIIRLNEFPLLNGLPSVLVSAAVAVALAAAIHYGVELRSQRYVRGLLSKWLRVPLRAGRSSVDRMTSPPSRNPS